MKRLAGIIAVLGAIAAVAWAMRDRFISVASSREPEPPRFRAVESGEPLAAIDGIGPVYQSRLTQSGIADMADLAKASPDSVAEAAGVSAGRARDWISQARSRTSG